MRRSVGVVRWLLRGADEREESGAVVRVEGLLFGVTFTIPPFALRASTYPANTATLLSLRDISPNRGITFTQGRQPLSLCVRVFFGVCGARGGSW